MRCGPETPAGGGAEPHKRYVAHVLRSALKALLGESGLAVLEFHLNRRLREDMYEVFYDDPHRFYNAMKNFFGSGVDAILRIIAQKLIEEGHIDVESPKAFVEVFNSPGEESRQRLRKMFGHPEARVK
mgnify:CR=1 FL=1